MACRGGCTKREAAQRERGGGDRYVYSVLQQVEVAVARVGLKLAAGAGRAGVVRVDR
jgi:hypothetical protein